MLAALVSHAENAGRVRLLSDTGVPEGPVVETTDLAATVAGLERTRPRWLWPATAEVYPDLLARGVRVERCLDLHHVESLLLAHQGRHREPRELGAALARLRGLPVPPDHGPRKRDTQPTLFEPEREPLPGAEDPLAAVLAVHAEQQRVVADLPHADRLRLLFAAESASALAAAEMTHAGLPWRADVHEDLLVELLGPRPAAGARPSRLAELADRITAAFGGRAVNPDHPPGIVRAFGREGIEIPSARAWVLKDVDHPAVAPLLEYKELARLWVAHGWSWLDQWVSDGRFRADYVVGGVVSGRWATRGGAALQIPRTLRRAVLADPGWQLVAADASQLEPRVLAALSGDRRLTEVSGDDDLYTNLAADAFDGDRGRAKIAMLSAMYGGTSGEAGPLLAVLRRRFPDAVGYVEAAATAGEQGRLVRSRLGRTSPPPSEAWHETTGNADEGEDAARQGRRAAREWGRFTRNFVVQASAADWTAALLGALRRRLQQSAPEAHLVFFQHDEVLVHSPVEMADVVCAEITAAGVEASRLVFGDTPVHFPINATPVNSYADAK
ncbi:bifunctional 3'-5' exonuclease/DNA polymerase [Actinosynnema sp. NPDC047251]|uniref:DNA-directed DNA polymerase n=1 Tax=Saccharothrix espanaensis (strain ATCC 51144 / DSM 44229 / JCM 9112 / NBRC 15066 / NRRL 15764) TaxID=1179773 RepID=K0JWR9_SACES|nr:bifunctional 3'-5' exonuclease/DNA polymerase [Saccharothrix espanaensis]CCH28608.1 DNA-directed DNA polymerase [Saccharothrix espanaensis DSM 44229]